MQDFDRQGLAPYPVRSISIAAPAYNEAEGIVPVLESWLKVLDGLTDLVDYEIVICNDGSKDATGQLLSDLSMKNPHVKFVNHAVNRGGGVAIATAIQKTRFDWVLLTDSDGQYDLSSLPEFIRQVEECKVRAATGVRAKKRDTLFNQLGSRASGFVCNLFHGTNYRDFNCSLKLIDGFVLRSLCLEAKGLNYSTEISSKLIERGERMAEVVVEHRPRTTGRSSAQNVKAAWERFLFVYYIGVRQFLLRNKVIRVD
jgi:glycosyltransferase involved in cell wall biosynthesis